MQDTDFLDADLARITTKLMETREELEAAEAIIHRYAQGLNAFLWKLEEFPAGASITKKMASDMLDAVGVYGETGRTCGVIERALGELS